MIKHIESYNQEQSHSYRTNGGLGEPMPLVRSGYLYRRDRTVRELYLKVLAGTSFVTRES